MARLQRLSDFLDSTDLPAEIVQLWEGSFHFCGDGVNFRLEHQCERPKETEMSKSENAKSYADRAAAEPTELHRNFAAWIEEKTGYAPDLKTVQIVCAMRMDFQASPENQDHLAERKAAAEAKRKQQAAEKKARLEKQLAALQAELAKETAASTPAVKPAPVVKKTAAKPVEAATPTPAEPAKAAEAPATPAKRAPRTRRTATAAKATETSK